MPAAKKIWYSVVDKETGQHLAWFMTEEKAVSMVGLIAQKHGLDPASLEVVGFGHRYYKPQIPIKPATAWPPQRITALRERLGLEPSELAQILGLSWQHIWRWEQGVLRPGECERIMLDLIDQHQDVAERLFSYPFTPVERWGYTLQNLQKEYGLSRVELNALLYVPGQRGPYHLTPCLKRMLDWFINHFEEAAPYLWPQLLGGGENIQEGEGSEA